MKKGFSLVEMLFYISILSLFLGIIISSMFTLTKNFRRAEISRTIESNALNVLNRLSREIKNAKEIDLIETILNSDQGKIKLNGTDENSADYSLEFYLQNGLIKLKKDGNSVGELTSSSTEVTSFKINKIETGISTAIKLTFTLTAGNENLTQTENFYSTSIIKNSY